MKKGNMRTQAEAILRKRQTCLYLDHSLLASATVKQCQSKHSTCSILLRQPWHTDPELQIQRLQPYSALPIDPCLLQPSSASSCSGWKPIQSFSLWARCRVRKFGTHHLKWDVSIQFLLSGLWELCRRGGRKILRTRGEGRCQGNEAFQTQQGWYTHELTETVAAHTEPAQI